MADTPPPKKTQKKSKKSKRIPLQPDPARLNSLSWNGSFAGDEDTFALIAGGDEGGFLALEEIDEVDYGLIDGIPDPDPNGNAKSKKRKRGKRDVDSNGDSAGDSCVVQAEDDGSKSEKSAAQKNKKSRRNQKKKKIREAKEKARKNGEPAEVDVEEPCPELVPILDDEPIENGIEDDANDELLLNDDEVYEWKMLRLHPHLVKSIRKLGFREPTPIQKACIPAAAHQGKDVIGAAVTGSGKTLAFGLPILQRLLEEQEKTSRMLQNEEKSVENVKGGPLRALIITPTRELALQVSDHLKAAAKDTDIRVVPIVGGMSSEKQERLLKRRPEIIVGTPGRLWELMAGGNQHLVELHSLSFFVLDEADRMIENGHFQELQSIIDMLPMAGNSVDQCSQATQICKTVPNLQRKKRQTFVFSATIALSDNFRRKLKRSSSTSKPANTEGISSIETLSERAGMRPDAAIVDLTNATILADRLEESFIECREEDKEAYLYYILSVHGQGRTIVFCTSIAALRRISSLLSYLGIKLFKLHSKMQQRARLKAIDNFRSVDDAVMIATDVAARGLDISGVRTVVHYQLPHSAEVYIHRSGRTARASADGCSIALISPSDKAKFVSLCKSMSKESLRQFPLDDSYLPEVIKRVCLTREIEKLKQKDKQENVKKKWLERNAEFMELIVEDSSSEDEKANERMRKKSGSRNLERLEKDLKHLLEQPLQSKTFSRRYWAGAGVSPILQQQLEQWTHSKENKTTGFVVIGQDCVEPLQALRSSGREVSVSVDKARELRKTSVNLKRKQREEKKKTREKLRKDRKRARVGMT